MVSPHLKFNPCPVTGVMTDQYHLLVIRAGTWKIYTTTLEAEIEAHPLISQAIALGIPDPICGEQVAVLVLPRGHDLCREKSISELSLANIRRWLTTEKKMAPFKQPSMLRIVKSRDEIPVTGTMKPIKAKIREVLFSKEHLDNGTVECCKPDFSDLGVPAHPWEYEGLQL